MEVSFEMDHKVFYNDADEAMAFKNQHSELSVLISIENDPEEEESFWTSFYVESIIKDGFIVVRMNKIENSEKINQFSQLVNIDSVPSLFYFAANSIGVTYKWNTFPQPKQFNRYFSPKSATAISSNSEPTADGIKVMPLNMEMTPQDMENTSMEMDLSSSDLNSTVQSIEVMPLDAQITPQEMDTIPQFQDISPESNKRMSFSEQNNEITPKKPKKARIAAQFNTTMETCEFEPEQTLGELRDWVATIFGPDHLIFVVHQGAFLPNDDDITIKEAGLCPSAKLMIRDTSAEIFANPDPENPVISLEENPQNVITHRPSANRGCFMKFVRTCLSAFDPWTDYEEKEDFFEKKPMYDN